MSDAASEFAAEWFAYHHGCPAFPPGSRRADIELWHPDDQISTRLMTEAQGRIPWIPYDEYVRPWGVKTRPPTSLPEYGGFRVVP